MGFSLPYAWGADDVQPHAKRHGKAYPYLQALFADLYGKPTEGDLLQPTVQD